MISDHYEVGFSVSRPTITQDAGGAAIETFSTTSTFRAHIEPLSGGQRLVNGKQELYSTHRIFCATSVDVVADDRIIFSGKAYKVTYINTFSIGTNPHKEVYARYEE